MTGTEEQDGADVIPMGLWFDELLSTELDLQAPPAAVFERHTVSTATPRPADTQKTVQ